MKEPSIILCKLNMEIIYNVAIYQLKSIQVFLGPATWYTMMSLVSFVSKIELSNDFNIDAMKFADEMNEQYCNDAPLFTDEESLFRLSADAEVIGGCSFFSAGTTSPYTTIISVQPQHDFSSCASAIIAQTNAQVGKNFRQTQPEASFAFAA